MFLVIDDNVSKISNIKIFFFFLKQTLGPIPQSKLPACFHKLAPGLVSITMTRFQKREKQKIS